MQTPSVVGRASSEPVIIPLRPPEQAVSNQEPPEAIAVAALDAYASAPAPPVRRINQCSVEDPVDYPPPRPINSAPSRTTTDLDQARESTTEAMTPRTLSEGGSTGSGSTSRGLQKFTNGLVRGMEMIFGDAPGVDADLTKCTECIAPRQLLPWSVIFSYVIFAPKTNLLIDNLCQRPSNAALIVYSNLDCSPT